MTARMSSAAATASVDPLGPVSVLLDAGVHGSATYHYHYHHHHHLYNRKQNVSFFYKSQCANT